MTPIPAGRTPLPESSPPALTAAAPLDSPRQVAFTQVLPYWGEAQPASFTCGFVPAAASEETKPLREVTWGQLVLGPLCWGFGVPVSHQPLLPPGLSAFYPLSSLPRGP